MIEPFAIKLSVGDEKFDIALEQVTHNLPAEPAMFDFPKPSGEPLPDMNLLLKRLSDHQDSLDKLLDQYAYTQVVTSRGFDRQAP